MLNSDFRTIGVIAATFGDVVQARKYTVYACAVMPDHVHRVVREHRDSAEGMIGHFQRAGAAAVRAAGVCDGDHRACCSLGWKVFLDHPDEIRRTVRYVEENPVKARMPRQGWGFVKAYDGWPLHPGHDPNSPYARRMRGRGDR